MSNISTVLIHFYQYKKPLLAWSLLLLLFTQQVVGRAYWTVVSTVEMDAKMNDTETRIADIIHEDIGFESIVRVHDEEQIDHLLSMGYGTPFLAAEIVNGDTAYFSVQQEEFETTQFTHLDKAPQQQDTPTNHQVSIEKWFPDFCFEHTTISIKGIDLSCIILFPFEINNTDSQHSIPSPPPEFA